MTKRRLIGYWNNTKEVIMSLMPFIIPLFYILLILVALIQVKKYFSNDPNLDETVFSTVFPILTLFGIILAAGIYTITPVTDREDKCRYLLNFAGMRSTSYYIGLLIGDVVIFYIPQVLLIAMVFILDLQKFKEHAFAFFFSILIFSFGYIPLVYCVSFIFDKAETAFKYAILTMIAFTAVPAVLASLTGSSALATFFEVMSPYQALLAQTSDILGNNDL